MFKWLLTALLIALILVRTPLAKKIRLGDLPGDLRWESQRFAWLKLHLPLTSTLLITAALLLLSRIL